MKDLDPSVLDLLPDQLRADADVLDRFFYADDKGGKHSVALMRQAANLLESRDQHIKRLRQEVLNLWNAERRPPATVLQPGDLDPLPGSR